MSKLTKEQLSTLYSDALAGLHESDAQALINHIAAVEAERDAALAREAQIRGLARSIYAEGFKCGREYEAMPFEEVFRKSWELEEREEAYLSGMLATPSPQADALLRVVREAGAYEVSLSATHGDPGELADARSDALARLVDSVRALRASGWEG